MDGSPFTTVGKREPAGKGSDSKGGATRGTSGDEDSASGFRRRTILFWKLRIPCMGSFLQV
jgi:hypothetical protein